MEKELKPKKQVIDLYHAKRRVEILKAHPEIRHLFRSDPSFKYVALASTLTQLLVAYLVRNEPIGFIIFVSLTVGTMFDCVIANAMHELVHEMAFDGKPFANKVLNCIVNLGCGAPVCGLFHYSHRYHHSYLGCDLDAKYPTIEEAQKYDYSLWGRFKFIFAHPILPGKRWEAISPDTANGSYATWNKRTIWLADLLIFYFCGYKSMLYLWLAFWVHECIFIQGAKNYADHWVTETESHTNSYYGFINLFNCNIGYHREHHDFPKVPGRYLPVLREIAKEFYSDETYIVKNIFADCLGIFLAKPGKGIMRYANKLTLKEVEVY